MRSDFKLSDHRDIQLRPQTAAATWKCSEEIYCNATEIVYASFSCSILFENFVENYTWVSIENFLLLYI